MTQDEIKKTKKSLLIPFIIGMALIVIGIAFREMGTMGSGIKIAGIYIIILGLVVAFTAGRKLLAFRSYLKKNPNDNQNDSSK